MEFRLLGTVSIAAEAGELPLGPAKRRSVLAALLLRANAVVPVDRLIDTVWEEDPPARARTVVQGHVSRLRALFEQGGAEDYGVELATHAQAYELRMPDQLLDTHRFEELVQLAGHQKHPGDAVLMLREALSLWRGPALTGTVASEPLLVAARALEETRLVSVEQLAAAYGRLGEHAKAAALLRAEAAANPLRESLAATLILSLYRAGHQSDALDCYHRTRTQLADELGVDPGPALRAAYEAVLRGLPAVGQGTVHTGFPSAAGGTGTGGLAGSVGSGGIVGSVGAGGPVDGPGASRGHGGGAHEPGGPLAHGSTHDPSGHAGPHGAGGGSADWGAHEPGGAHGGAHDPSRAFAHGGAHDPNGAFAHGGTHDPNGAFPHGASHDPRGTFSHTGSQGIGGEFIHGGAHEPGGTLAGRGAHDPAGMPAPGGTHPAGSVPPGSPPHGPLPAGPFSPGPVPPGSHPTGAHSAGPLHAAAHPTASHPAGAHPSGAHPSGAHPAGAHPSGHPATGALHAGADPGGGLPRGAALHDVGGLPAAGASAAASAWPDAPWGVPAAAGAAPGGGLGAPAPPPLPAPDLLPRTPRGFLGRERELAALDAAVDEARVALVTGPAGVGKTAFALHWAHRRADDFPDGVLYADLRGFSADEGLDAADVLREFLPALGVPPRRVPESATAAAALYRSLTEGRALLVVLDNVRSADRARPLLPAGARSAAVVTSRLRLGGLVASELARPVPLGVLGRDESAALLAAAVGADRIAAEPDAARRLAELCDGLPLALRVTAAQLAARPSWRLADLAAELADEQRRLALLSVDGADSADGSGVAAALRLTVQGLPEEAARLFRQLGVVTGTDLDRPAAAALLDRAPAVAAEALDRLCDAHLLTEWAPGRHTLHDLVRLYARSLDPDEDALLRLLDHYTLTAMAAARAAEPDDQPCCAAPSEARVPRTAPHFAGRDAALLWYAAERDNLAAAVASARAAGHHDRAWRLGILQWPYILWNSHDGWVPLLEDAVDSAARIDDPDAESRARALLGWLLTQDGRLAEALVHLRLAPALAARAGEPSSEATALVNLAVALDRTGVTPESLGHTARAVALVRGTGDVMTEVLALEHRARQFLAAGDPSAALACAREGLALDGDTVNGLVGIRHSMMHTTAGAALLDLGHPAEAEAALLRARELGVAHGYQEGVRRADAELRRLREPADR
ncbi:BTAD domain-containing putative transcriptional regulator [Streptomyces sp. NPDC053431]|uniref:AfsR/SARP family transcriptional regulator n=1 Tax=Streptomyces sp. NPDC053431 TaxID=3365703 RepID=UPI0037D1C1BD